MSPVPREPPAGEPQVELNDLADRLTTYDEYLRLGLRGNLAEVSTAVDTSGLEIESLYQCLDLLEAAWPRARPAENGEMPTQLGRFQLERVLGVGGFGVVYLAFDPTLHRLVALKVPRLHSLASESLRARFQREARAAAALDHPHIVPIHETGQIGPICYIVAAYCEGPNLAEWLKTQTAPVPVRLAARLIGQLAAAIHYSHSLGVLHRDLKPSNVLLVRDESTPAPDELPFVPRISDFGLAKQLEDDNQASLSMTVGTPAYMAPEQAGLGRHPIGPAADIYGLGAILYELLTGRPPFQGTNLADVFDQLRNNEPVPPRLLRPDIPRDLEAICLKCLQREPLARYHSAQDLADDLQRFLSGEPTKARPPELTRRIWRTLRRQKIRTRILLSVLLMAVVVISAVSWRVHQVSVAAGTKAEAQFLATSVARQARYPLDLHYAFNLLYDSAAGGSDRAQAAQQAREILEKYIPLADEPELRGFEWHYLWKSLHPSQASPSLTKLHEILAHQQDAYFVAFSPDGTRLATAGKDGTARVWDAETARPLYTLSGHDGEVNWVEFSPDGQILATASDDRTVRRWNAANGEFQETLWSHTAAVVGVAFNPVNRHVAAVADDGAIRVWDLSGRREVISFIAHDGSRIEALTYSPDGRLLATGTNGDGLRIWDASKSYAPYEGLGHYPVPAETVCFSQDGRLIALAHGREVQVVQVATGQLLSRNNVPGDGVRSVRFLEDDRTLIVAGQRSSTGLLDWRTGEFWDAFDSTSDFWCAASAGVGQRLAMTDYAGTLRLWDSSTRRNVDRTEFPLDPYPVAISPDGTRMAASGRPPVDDDAQDGGGISLWDVTTPQPKQILNLAMPDRRCEILSVAFSPDNQEIAAGIANRHGVRLLFFDANTGQELRQANDPQDVSSDNPCQRILYSPDGSGLVTLHACGGGPRALRFRDPATGEILRSHRAEWQLPPESIMTFSPAGDLFATTGVSNRVDIDFFRVADLNKIVTWGGFNDPVESFVFTPDGRRVVVKCGGNRLSIHHHETGETLDSFTAPPAYVHDGGLAISPDGRTLALGAADGVVLVHVDSGKTLCVLRVPSSLIEIDQVAFSSNGKILTARARTVDGTWRMCLWRIDSPNSFFNVDSH